MSETTALVPVAPARERSAFETVELAAKAGTAILLFGAYAVVIGGGIYLAWRGLKRLRLL